MQVVVTLGNTTLVLCASGGFIQEGIILAGIKADVSLRCAGGSTLQAGGLVSKILLLSCCQAQKAEDQSQTQDGKASHPFQKLMHVDHSVV